jgi:hypothetical protein
VKEDESISSDRMVEDEAPCPRIPGHGAYFILNPFNSLLSWLDSSSTLLLVHWALAFTRMWVVVTDPIQVLLWYWRRLFRGWCFLGLILQKSEGGRDLSVEELLPYLTSKHLCH